MLGERWWRGGIVSDIGGELALRVRRLGGGDKKSDAFAMKRNLAINPCRHEYQSVLLCLSVGAEPMDFDPGIPGVLAQRSISQALR